MASRLAALKEEVKRLACERDGIEARVSESSARLAATGVGMDKALVDGEGFPLPGLDLHAIREDRHRIIVLSNDHKALTKRIDAVIQDLHAAAQATGDAGAGGGPTPMATSAPPPPRPRPAAPQPRAAPPGAAMTTATAAHVGFAVVDEVSPGSPAESAGLRLGDRVLSVGAEVELAGVPPAVAAAAAAGSVLPVSILRAGAVMQISLSPRADWGGRGVLGCRLRPV